MNKTSEVIYFDDRIIVVNKAPGVATVADRHGMQDNYLLKWLHQKFDEVYPVHRLDTNTSGLICFARTGEEQRRLSQIFEERKVIKKYKAIVLGIPKPEHGIIEAPILRQENKNQVIISPKGKPAITYYTVERALKNYALLDLRLETGRTHQIRVHLQHIGHPLLVDPMYGGQEMFLLSNVKSHFRGDRTEERPLLSRTPLHAFHLEIPRPDGTMQSFEIVLPKDMMAVLKQLEKLYSAKR